jgi:hypothetical protein
MNKKETSEISVSHVIQAIDSENFKNTLEENAPAIQEAVKKATVDKGPDPLNGLSIGRVVIFTAATKRQFPAIVVKVVDPATGMIDAQIFSGDTNGSELYRNLPFSATPKSDSWCWPQRV